MAQGLSIKHSGLICKSCLCEQKIRFFCVCLHAVLCDYVTHTNASSHFLYKCRISIMFVSFPRLINQTQSVEWFFCCRWSHFTWEPRHGIGLWNQVDCGCVYRCVSRAPRSQSTWNNVEFYCQYTGNQHHIFVRILNFNKLIVLVLCATVIESIVHIERNSGMFHGNYLGASKVACERTCSSGRTHDHRSNVSIFHTTDLLPIHRSIKYK